MSDAFRRTVQHLSLSFPHVLMRDKAVAFRNIADDLDKMAADDVHISDLAGNPVDGYLLSTSDGKMHKVSVALMGMFGWARAPLECLNGAYPYEDDEQGVAVAVKGRRKAALLVGEPLRLTPEERANLPPLGGATGDMERTLGIGEDTKEASQAAAPITIASARHPKPTKTAGDALADKVAGVMGNGSDADE